MKLSELKNVNPNSTYLGEGLFLKKGLLKSVENLSNQTFTSGFKADLCLKLNIELDNDFTTSIFLFSNYIRDKNNKIIGWKIKNSPIIHFIMEFIGDIDIPDDWNIPDVVTKINNIPIIFLQYCIGEYENKPSFSNFQYVLKDVENAKDKLLEIFNNQATYLISRNKNSYKPDFYETYMNSKNNNSDNIDLDNENNNDSLNNLPF